MSRSSVAPLVSEEAETGCQQPSGSPGHPVSGVTNQAFELPPLQQSRGGTPIMKRRLPNIDKNNEHYDHKMENGIEKQNGYNHNSHDGGHGGQTVITSLDLQDNEQGRSSLDYRTDLDLQFYKALGPIIKGMTFCGLWHGYIVDPVNNPPPKTTYKKIFNSKTYCVVVQILLWLNVIKYVPSFFTGSVLAPERTFVKVILQFFTLQCALNASVFFWCLSKQEKVAIFFHHFEVAVQSNPVTAVDTKWLNRASKACLVVAVIFMILHCLNQSSTALLPLEVFRNNSVVFIAPFYYNLGLQLIFIVIFLFNFAAWIFPLLFFVLICVMLSRQFVKFDARLEKSLRKARIEGCFPRDFEVLRRQHEALATALDVSNDGLFTYVNLVTYMTMAPLACFLLYRIISPVQYAIGITGWAFYWTWMFSIFINVVVVSWMAAITSTKAHDPRERLFMVNLSKINNEEIMQMNVFLSRLSGDPIGYTIFDLVTITKPFILTIAGLLLTYYALISELGRD